MPKQAEQKRARLRDRLELLALIAIVLVVAGISAHSSFFTGDDFINFRIALDRGFNHQFLATPIFQHFAPGHRAGDYFLIRYFPMNFDVAIALMLVMFGVAMAAFHGVCTELFGRSRWNLLPTLLFGTSSCYLRVVQWWAGAAHTLPGVMCTLIGLWAFLYFQRTRNGWVLALGAIAYAGGLAFYSKTLLLALYMPLIVVLFMTAPLSLRSIWAALWRERIAWIAYAIPALAYLLNYALHDYANNLAPSLADMTSYVKIAWLRGFSPGLIGQSVPGDALTSGDRVAIVLAQLFVLGGVLLSILRKPSAWRAWVFFAIVAGVNILIVGRERVEHFGPGIGYDQRYLTEIAFLFPLALGFAFYRFRNCGRGRADTSPQPVERPLVGALADGTPFMRHAAPVLLAIGVVAYAASYLNTAHAFTQDSQGKDARGYIGNVKRSLRALKAQGRPPVLLDSTVPPNIVQDFFVGYNRIGPVLTEVDRSVQIGGTARSALLVDGDGQIYDTRFVRLDSQSPLRKRKGRLQIDGAKLRERNGRVCIEAAGDIPAYVTYFPPAAARGDHLYLRTVVEPSPTGLGLPLFVDRGAGLPPVNDRTIATGPGQGEAVTELGAKRIKAVRIDVPPGSPVCIRALETGNFVKVAQPVAGQ